MVYIVDNKKVNMKEKNIAEMVGMAVVYLSIVLLAFSIGYECGRDKGFTEALDIRQYEIGRYNAGQ